MQRLKNTTPLFVLWYFINSAVYPYTGGLTLVAILNLSSTYFLKLSAVAYHLTWSSHGSRSKESGYGNVELNKKIYSQYNQPDIVAEDTFR